MGLFRDKKSVNSKIVVAAETSVMMMQTLECRTLMAAFTAGDFVVYRVGTGAAALGSTGTAVFLDEYSPTGTLVQSIAMPTAAGTGTSANPLTASGTATSEGLLSLSSDGRYLVVPGYDAAAGTASVTSAVLTGTITAATNASPIVCTTTSTTALAAQVTISGAVGNTAMNGTWFAKVLTSTTFSLYQDAALTVPVAGNGTYTASSATFTATGTGAILREIGRVDGNGNIDTTTTLGSALSANNVRSATSDNGSNIWAAGATGDFYTTQGSSSTAIALASQNSRQITIANGQLYVTSGSSPFAGVSSVGSGKATSGTQTLTLAAASASPYEYLFATLNGGSSPDTLYIADNTNGIEKFSLVGSTWTQNGTGIALSGTTKSGDGLTGSVSGTTVTLYATDNSGHLVKLVDSTGYNATITATPTLLTTAATNTAFRGVALVPSAAVVAPTVTAITPNAGATAGGTSVTITGTGFSTATTVSFGTNNATSFIVNSTTSITAVSPAGSSTGQVDVTVTNSAGTSTTGAADLFTYTASPVVGSLAPAAGPAAGGTSVVITGSNFTGATAVKFGTANATSFVVNSLTQITATAPAGSSGAVDVIVTTPGGTSSASTADQFTYVAAPTVTSLNLTSGADSGGNLITITGTGFTAASTVSFNSTSGNKPGTGVTFVNSTTLTVKSPAFAAGTAADVVVTTAGGSSAVSTADRFTYGLTTIGAAELLPSGTAGVTIDSNPVITQILTLPGTVINGGGTKTYADGGYSFFVQDSTGSAEVFFTSTSTPLPAGYTPTVGDTISVTGLWSPFNQIPEVGGTGANNVTSITKTGTAAVPPPLTNKAITDLNVTMLPSSVAGYIIDLTGVNIGSITPTGTTTFGTAAIKGVLSDTANTPHTLVLSYSASSSTPFNNLGGTTIPTNTLVDVIGYVQESTSGGVTTPQFVPLNIVPTTVAPVLTGVSPAVGPTAGGNTVTINGYGFTGVSEVDFGSGNPGTIVSNTDQQIVVTAPAGSLGAVDVSVITANGTSAQSSSDTYTYSVVPFVSGVSPVGGPLAGGTTVTISGVNFTGATSVSFGGTAATSFTVDPSGNSITAVIPAHTGGVVDVIVTTSGGGTSSATSTDKFTYAVPPAVTSLGTTTGPTAGTTSVVITGSGFTGATGVSFGGTPASSFTITDDSHITAVAPAHTAGAVDVVVTNPGGSSTVSNADKFTYTATTIAAAEALPASTLVTLQSNPVITAILSTPGTVNNISYTSYSITVNDGTGSAVVFGALPSGSSYVPTIGDTISVSGTWSPFHQIPELGTLTAISKTGTASVPTPLSKTISQVKLDPLPNTVAGYVVTLHNVTISGITGNFGTANITATITDSSGNMTLFYWPSSYSSANAFFDLKTPPTNPVDLTGFVSVFTDTTVTPNVDTIEFAPISESPTVASTTSVASSSNPAASGGNVTFTATTTPNATGTVTFFDGTSNIGTGVLSTTGGVTTASFTTSTPLTDGSHSITALYGGDLNFVGSTSAILTQTVGAASLPAWLSAGSAATWNSTTHVLTVTGAATIIADPGSDQPIITGTTSAAQVVIASTAGPFIHIGGVNLSGGAAVDVQSVGPSRSHTNHNALVIGSSTVAPFFSIANSVSDHTSQLNLEDNDLIAHSSTNSDAILAAVRAAAAEGRNVAAGGFLDGTWNGHGLTSSAAASQDAAVGIEGYILAVERQSEQLFAINNWSLQGLRESIGANDIMVKYTYNGDLGLTGAVDSTAQSVFSAFYDGSSSDNFFSYVYGDLNGDGIIDSTDQSTFSALYGLGLAGSGFNAL